jgi:biotin operon repressor
MARQSDDNARRGKEAGDDAPPQRATRPRPGGRLGLVDPQANSRLIIFLTGNFLHRIERDRCELCFGDLDLARIAEIIGLIAIESGMRDAAFRDRNRSLQTVIGIAGQRAVNAASIAAATGIPRETVRRKLKRLLALGYIIEKGRAHYVIAPGTLQQPDRQAVFDRTFRQLTLFLNDMLEKGLLQWIPASDVARPGTLPRSAPRAFRALKEAKGIPD